jgi:hypothetical protein
MAATLETAHLLVEKRTYKPAGWKKLRTVTLPCRTTAKRVYVKHGAVEIVFDRETGQEILPVESRINRSIRYSLRCTAEVKFE